MHKRGAVALPILAIESAAIAANIANLPELAASRVIRRAGPDVRFRG
jgi:hypothetical protein